MTQGSSPVRNRYGSFEEALADAFRLVDGDPHAALEQAEALVQIKQDSRVFRLAAAACRKLGRKGDAEAAELRAIEASLAEPELEQAAIAETEGRHDKARALSEGFLGRRPDDLLAATLAAEAAISLWDLDRAELLLRQVIERAPTFLRALMLRVKCLQRQSLPKEGIAVAEKVIQRKPNNLPALTYLAQLSSEIGDGEKTVAASQRILALDGQEPDRWIHHGHYLRVLGKADKAREAFRQALAIKPHSGAAWWGLANYYPSALDDADVQAIEAAIPASAGTQDEATLNLALGLMAGRRGEHAKSFHNISAGKRLRLEAFPFNPDAASAAIDEALRAFSAEYFELWKDSGSTAAAPIFLIGMHRSGSTLVERILGRHSQLEGAGELPVLPRVIKCFQQTMKAEGRLEERLASIRPEGLKHLGERYVERTADYRRSTKPWFIDKLNFNWMHLGLIRSALPNARIIDVRRNAVDCCWANFKMLFTEGHPASNDLRHIGRFYRDYARFVDSIDPVAPGGILKVRYEDVVDDIGGETRRMLEFLGLEFEPQCLEFHKATDSVATASSEQVRQPLNRQGIGSAEPYRPWLAPLIEELGPLAERSESSGVTG